MSRLTVFAALAAVVLGVAAAAQGAPPTPDNPAGNVLGVVPAHGAGHGHGGGSANLSYHSGPVMRTNVTYTFYWDPSASISSSYEGLVDQFLADVAAADGQTSNVYATDTQYYDGTGKIGYGSTWGGRLVDTNPFPKSGCSDPYTTTCLTDAQIQTELNSYLSGLGLPRGLGTVYFVLTPKGVGSCYSGSECAFTYYCAYHSSFGSGSSTTLYANMPYAATVPAACGPGQSPNANDGDATINVLSHEHNEAITDPLGNAWYDSRGQENGDKCAWNFGAASGPSGAQYNQTINGHPYYLQQEWSNAISGCALHG
jgi:hypothetical protein